MMNRRKSFLINEDISGMMWDDTPSRKGRTKRERLLVYNEQKGRCNYCGIKLPASYMQLDHKNPLERSGSDRFSNLQGLCAPCNTRKGSMTDGEFRRKYKLPPARKASGPPTKRIPQGYFDEITKKAAKRRRQRERDDWLW